MLHNSEFQSVVMAILYEQPKDTFDNSYVAMPNDLYKILIPFCILFC